MVQKHRISTNIGEDQKIVVELKQDYDLLEILSLKFTQKEVYASLCSDYGVVVGRITANSGFGIPNAKVSIFIPISSTDENDPVISTLYPYKLVNDRNEDGYRYNLLPKRQQHSGHTPTGTFPDQSEVISREEVLEVYEKYYNYTVKTNDSGDFMIWGVPVGTQNIHVDVDLSDMGCFSLRPYDFIRKGIGAENFERYYQFKASTDIDGLPQIVSFDKTIEVYPFWGNIELCELGISRVDFDLSERGIKIEPISLILASAVTDDNSSAIKRNGKLKKGQGYKCNLQVYEGTVDCVRFTGKKQLGSDGITQYPDLEYFNITEGIDENGSTMIVLPMNMEYVITNEFGEQEFSNSSTQGIPTTTIARFRFNLSFKDRKVTTASYLIPNIREYNSDNNGHYHNEASEQFLTTYQFSDIYEDYLSISGITGMSMTPPYIDDKNSLILGTNNGGVPEDYFYKFIYGKVYTVSSFQGSIWENENFQTTKDAILGIKEIRPSIENDCASSTNYFPTNFAFRNRIKFGLILSQFVLLVQYIYTLIVIKVFEVVANGLFNLGLIIGNIGFDIRILSWHPFKKFAERIIVTSLGIVESGQKTLPLVTYPDCEPCTVDDENVEPQTNENLNTLYYRSAEVKTLVVPDGGYINLIFQTGQLPDWFNASTTTGTTFLPSIFPNDAAKESESTTITESDLLFLDGYTTPLYSDPNFNYKYAADIYPLIGSDSTTDTFTNFYAGFAGWLPSEGPINIYFENVTVQLPTNVSNSISGGTTNGGWTVQMKYVDIAGGLVGTNTQDILIQILIRNPCYGYSSFRSQYLLIPSGSTSVTYDLNLVTCPFPPGGQLREEYVRIVSISGSTSGANGIPQWNTNISTSITGPAIRLSYLDWAKFGPDYFSDGGIEGIKDLYAIVRIYDRGQYRTGTTNNQLTIEEGCSKYDKFYDETVSLTFLYGTSDYGTIDIPSNGPPNSISLLLYDQGDWIYNQNFAYGIPIYDGTSFIESLTNPGINYNLLANIAGTSDTLRLPKVVNFQKLGEKTFSKKTKSGLTEIRDGVITIVPAITIFGGKSQNSKIIREWYRRKRIGLFFCGGVVNFAFIDNWLNGVLYFFKFDRRIKWDDEQNRDLNVRATKYPRELVFYNIIDKNFYYRSTPYNPDQGFIGNIRTIGNKRLLHPTTFYDLGVRDEFLKEICTDTRVDPTCSVIRDIGVTTYQDPANILEYAINYRLDTTASTFQLEDFFNGTFPFVKIKTLDGDIVQLISINSEVGIEAFDLDSPQYFIYNGEFMDPEDPYLQTYFKSGGSYGPTPIDFKLDDNGRFLRLCLNYRLGDYSQKVPFYLWNKGGQGFGPYTINLDQQRFLTNGIAEMKLQRIFSIENVGDTLTNYSFPDGEEEYLLRPMTITHGTFAFTGNTFDALERFEVISLYAPDTSPSAASGYTESNLWLQVKTGTVTDPIDGYIYVVINDTWTKIVYDVLSQDASYVKDFREVFLFPTQNNYDGNKQVLSTPFFFYFGLKPGKTALDTFIKYFGPKLPKTKIIYSGTTGNPEPTNPSPTPSPTPTPTPSITPTITPTPTVSRTSYGPAPTPSLTVSISPGSSQTPTPSITRTVTPTPSVTPSFTPTITPTKSITPTPSISGPNQISVTIYASTSNIVTVGAGVLTILWRVNGGSWLSTSSTVSSNPYSPSTITTITVNQGSYVEFGIKSVSATNLIFGGLTSIPAPSTGRCGTSSPYPQYANSTLQVYLNASVVSGALQTC